MSRTREKLGAIVFSFVMVTSVFGAVGIGVGTDTAAAAAPASNANVLDANGGLAADDNIVEVQDNSTTSYAYPEENVTVADVSYNLTEDGTGIPFPQSRSSFPQSPDNVTTNRVSKIGVQLFNGSRAFVDVPSSGDVADIVDKVHLKVYTNYSNGSAFTFTESYDSNSGVFVETGYDGVGANGVNNPSLRNVTRVVIIAEMSSKELVNHGAVIDAEFNASSNVTNETSALYDTDGRQIVQSASDDSAGIVGEVNANDSDGAPNVPVWAVDGFHALFNDVVVNLNDGDVGGKFGNILDASDEPNETNDRKVFFRVINANAGNTTILDNDEYVLHTEFTDQDDTVLERIEKLNVTNRSVGQGFVAVDADDDNNVAFELIPLQPGRYKLQVSDAQANASNQNTSDVDPRRKATGPTNRKDRDSDGFTNLSTGVGTLGFATDSAAEINRTGSGLSFRVFSNLTYERSVERDEGLEGRTFERRLVFDLVDANLPGLVGKPGPHRPDVDDTAAGRFGEFFFVAPGVTAAEQEQTFGKLAGSSDGLGDDEDVFKTTPFDAGIRVLPRGEPVLEPGTAATGDEGLVPYAYSRLVREDLVEIYDIDGGEADFAQLTSTDGSFTLDGVYAASTQDFYLVLAREETVGLGLDATFAPSPATNSPPTNPGLDLEANSKFKVDNPLILEREPNPPSEVNITAIGTFERRSDIVFENASQLTAPNELARDFRNETDRYGTRLSDDGGLSASDGNPTTVESPALSDIKVPRDDSTIVVFKVQTRNVSRAVRGGARFFVNATVDVNVSDAFSDDGDDFPIGTPDTEATATNFSGDWLSTVVSGTYRPEQSNRGTNNDSITIDTSTDGNATIFLDVDQSSSTLDETATGFAPPPLDPQGTAPPAVTLRPTDATNSSVHASLRFDPDVQDNTSVDFLGVVNATPSEISGVVTNQPNFPIPNTTVYIQQIDFGASDVLVTLTPGTVEPEPGYPGNGSIKPSTFVTSQEVFDDDERVTNDSRVPAFRVNAFRRDPVTGARILSSSTVVDARVLHNPTANAPLIGSNETDVSPSYGFVGTPSVNASTVNNKRFYNFTLWTVSRFNPTRGAYTLPKVPTTSEFARGGPRDRVPRSSYEVNGSAFNATDVFKTGIGLASTSENVTDDANVVIDVEASRFRIVSAQTTVAPDEIVVPSDATLTATVTVRNNGSIAAAADVRFGIDDNGDGSLGDEAAAVVTQGTTAPITPGETRQVELSLSAQDDLPAVETGDNDGFSGNLEQFIIERVGPNPDEDRVFGTVTINKSGGGRDGDNGLARFDADGSGRIELSEVLDAITAFNTGGTIGGEPVELNQVLDVITAFNTGQSV